MNQRFVKLSQNRINILYDATLIGHVRSERERRGIYFVVLNILRSFLNYDNAQVVVYYHPDLVESLDYFKKELNSCLFGCKNRPIIANERNTPFNQCEINVLINLWLWIPDWIRDLNVLKIMTIHDMMPFLQPGYSDFLKPGWFTNVMESVVCSDFLLTISNSSKQDICKVIPRYPRDRIHVTQLAVDNSKFHPYPESGRSEFLSKYGLKNSDKFMFSLSSVEPRKNIITNLLAFANFISKNEINDFYYLLGGGVWDNFESEVRRIVEKLDDNCKKHVKKIGYVRDDDLPKLYSYSEFFVYTSQYEGFGLPVLEAMSCGTPVVTSNVTAPPEITQDAAILVYPFSVESHVEAYKTLYFDREKRAIFANKSIRQANKFNWDRTAKDIIEFAKGKIQENNFVPIAHLRQKFYTPQCIPTVPCSKRKVFAKYKFYSLLSRVTFGKIKSKYSIKKDKYKKMFRLF